MGLLSYSVTAASAVVLIAAAAAVVVLVISASVVACKNENKDDEKNLVAVASVTKKHSVDLLSHLPLAYYAEDGKECINNNYNPFERAGKPRPYDIYGEIHR